GPFQLYGLSVTCDLDLPAVPSERIPQVRIEAGLPRRDLDHRLAEGRAARLDFGWREHWASFEIDGAGARRVRASHAGFGPTTLESVPLAALVFLGPRGDRFALDRLSVPEAAIALGTNVYQRGQLLPAERARDFLRLGDVARAVPAYRARFADDLAALVGGAE